MIAYDERNVRVRGWMSLGSYYEAAGRREPPSGQRIHGCASHRGRCLAEGKHPPPPRAAMFQALESGTEGRGRVNR